jgi:transcriptional regulator with XRE-family HTH domain
MGGMKLHETEATSAPATTAPDPPDPPDRPDRRDPRDAADPPERRNPPDPPARPRRPRPTAAVLRARTRSADIVKRCGVALRQARLAAGRTQAAAAGIARMSQSRWSRLERGTPEAEQASIEEWARAAEAVGLRFAAFMERASGADAPRDIEHLRRQSEVVRISQPGGWTAAPEMPLSIDAGGKVVDVLLQRRVRREATVVEVWDFLDDVGAALRGLDEKVAAVRRSLPGWNVQGAWVVRGTRRNHDLLRDLAPLVDARFPGDAVAWLEALGDPTAGLPTAPVLVWTGSSNPRLLASRRRPGAARAPPARRQHTGAQAALLQTPAQPNQATEQ